MVKLLSLADLGLADLAEGEGSFDILEINMEKKNDLILNEILALDQVFLF